MWVCRTDSRGVKVAANTSQLLVWRLNWTPRQLIDSHLETLLCSINTACWWVVNRGEDFYLAHIQTENISPLCYKIHLKILLCVYWLNFQSSATSSHTVNQLTTIKKSSAIKINVQLSWWLSHHLSHFSCKNTKHFLVLASVTWGFAASLCFLWQETDFIWVFNSCSDKKTSNLKMFPLAFGNLDRHFSQFSDILKSEQLIPQ